MRVLLVEDDPAVASGVRDGLASNGYTVDYVSNGTAALAAVASEPLPDIVLLDLGLPDMDGQDVCRSIRSDSQIPIIVISARGDEVDKVVGLELGADDYLAKPFGIRELIARMRAVTRRSTPVRPRPRRRSAGSNRSGHCLSIDAHSGSTSLTKR